MLQIDHTFHAGCPYFICKGGSGQCMVSGVGKVVLSWRWHHGVVSQRMPVSLLSPGFAPPTQFKATGISSGLKVAAKLKI